MSSKNKPNGHAALLAESSGATADTISLSGMGQAASVDASELPVATPAASLAVARAGREACADVAEAQGEGKQSPEAEAASRSHNENDGSEETDKAKRRGRKIPPGTEPLPIDGEAFVDAVHSRVDLVLLEEKLLNSKDEKVAQRELAYLRELRYGKSASSADDEVPQIIVDMQRPERDTP